MIEFNKSMIVTGAEQRVKKDGNTYILVHVLSDTGVTISCMYKGDPNKIMGLEKMVKYDIKFNVSCGQYTHLTVLDINKK